MGVISSFVSPDSATYRLLRDKGYLIRTADKHPLPLPRRPGALGWSPGLSRHATPV